MKLDIKTTNKTVGSIETVSFGNEVFFVALNSKDNPIDGFLYRKIDAAYYAFDNYLTPSDLLERIN